MEKAVDSSIVSGLERQWRFSYSQKLEVHKKVTVNATKQNRRPIIPGLRNQDTGEGGKQPPSGDFL